MAQRTITRAYDSYAAATGVVRALEGAGIPHSDISLVGRDGAQSGPVGTTGTGMTGTSTTGTGMTGTSTTGTGMTGTGTDLAHDTETEKGAGTGATIGTVLGGGAGLLAGIGSLAIPGVGPVVAAGWLIATLTGAGVGAAVGGGAGGLVGALTGAGVPDEDAHVYAETVRRGGNLVTVRADDSQVPTVEAIMDGQSAINTTTRRAEYQSSGWTRHDETAEPYAANTGTTGMGATGVGGTGIGSTTGTGLPPRTELP